MANSAIHLGSAKVQAFVDLGDVPAAYAAGSAGKTVNVNSTEDGLEFIAPVVVADPTEDQVAFYDEFIATSLGWHWVSYGTGAGKAITYPGGKVTMALSEGTSAGTGTGAHFGIFTFAPIGMAEFVCKISSVVLSKNAAFVMWLSSAPDAAESGNLGVQLFHYNNGTKNTFYGGNPGVGGSESGTTVATTIYLKIRFLGGASKNRFWFFWSEDGATWNAVESAPGVPLVYTDLGFGTTPKVMLLLTNWSDGGNYHDVSCDVEWFKITRPLGIRS